VTKLKLEKTERVTQRETLFKFGNWRGVYRTGWHCLFVEELRNYDMARYVLLSCREDIDSCIAILTAAKEQPHE
jgi:hypothetical protein